MPRRGARPPLTTLLLVRHGQTPSTGKLLPGRAAGLHLSEEGLRQADDVASRLAVLPELAAIYASPLERTRETARPLSRQRGLPVRIHRGLLECDFGDWTGRSLAELSKLPEWTTVQRYPSGFRFPNGESFPEMQARFVSALADIASRHQGQAVVCVSHADPIKAGVAAAMGTHLDLFQRITISTCSVTAIAYDAGGPHVLTVNSLGDLSSLRPS